MTVRVFEEASDQEIGVLSDAQFEFLQQHLESEDADDDDYYINRATVDSFAAAGGDPHVIAVLNRALGTADEADIRWEREEDEEEAEEEDEKDEEDTLPRST